MYYWPFLVAHLCKCQMLFAPQKEVLMSKFATIGEMLMQMYAHQVVRIFFPLSLPLLGFKINTVFIGYCDYLRTRAK